MSAEFTSHLPEFRKRHEAAVDAALVAAAFVLVNVIKKEVTTKGYTSGAFRNTLLRRNRIRASEPATENGARVIRVGVLSGIPVPAQPGKKPAKKQYTVGEIMLAWELGFVSLYTGKHERVEIFRPALLDHRQQIADAFAAEYARRMAA